MNRQAESRYPSRLSYVVKLRADATADELAGRIENLVTGHRLDFASAHELVDAIVDDMQGSAREPRHD